MRFNIAAAFVIALLMSACSSAPVDDYFSSPLAMQHAPEGMARLVFYYPKSFFWLGDTASVAVNGKDVCGLSTGTFALRNIRPAPNNMVKVSLCNTTSTSLLPLKTAANSTYYIRVLPNDQTVTGLIARYGLSKGPAKRDPASGKGVFWLDLVDESSALKELRGLKPCPQCN